MYSYQSFNVSIQLRVALFHFDLDGKARMETPTPPISNVELITINNVRNTVCTF